MHAADGHDTFVGIEQIAVKFQCQVLRFKGAGLGKGLKTPVQLRLLAAMGHQGAQALSRILIKPFAPAKQDCLQVMQLLHSDACSLVDALVAGQRRPGAGA